MITMSIVDERCADFQMECLELRSSIPPMRIFLLMSLHIPSRAVIGPSQRLVLTLHNHTGTFPQHLHV